MTHIKTSPEAIAIIEAIKALPTKDPLFRLIDLYEIIGQVMKEKEKNREPAMTIARGFKAYAFVHLGVPFKYMPPARVFNYEKIKEWKRAKKMLLAVEAAAKESLKAQEDGMDIGGMMMPPTVTYRKGYVCLAYDGALRAGQRLTFRGSRAKGTGKARPWPKETQPDTTGTGPS
jgi:hypothetical protein